MAVLKVACPKCGQRVSGDDSFFGTTVECPVCTSKVVFPERPESKPPPEEKKPEPKSEPESEPESKPDSEEGAWDPSEEKMPSRDTGSISLPPLPSGEEDHPGSPLLGVISMVTGILTVVCLCLPGILLGPIAVVLGHLGLASSRRSRVRPAPGENLALTGMILGYVGMAVSLVYLIILAFPDLPQQFRSGFGGGNAGE